MLRGQGLTNLRGSTYSEQKLEAEAGTWSQAPPVILEQILQILPAKDRWKCRQMCRSWAEVVRRTASFEVSILVTPQNVWSKLRALNKHRAAASYLASQFSLTFPTPVWAGTCANMLETLELQMLKGANTKALSLDVILAVMKTSEAEIRRLAARIAHSCKTLSSHGIQVRINIQRFAYSAPSAAVLELLAPFLCQWEDHKMTGGQKALHPSLMVLQSSLTTAHTTALSMATSLESLCVCITPPANSILAAIASLHSLTVLHLTILCVEESANLKPLAQLTSLEDFALQSFDDITGNSCIHVLRSSRNTLRAVQLGFFILKKQTYLALQSLPHLQAIMLKIRDLRNSDARHVVSLIAAKTIHVWVCNRFLPLSWSALTKLSQGQNITDLTLQYVMDAEMHHLQSMQGLKFLRILNARRLTGEVMCSLPQLEFLEIIDCFSITEAGVLRMVQAFPKLQIVKFEQSCDARLNLYLSQQALVAMTLWRHIEIIDLRGVRGVSKSNIAAMATSLLVQCLEDRPTVSRVSLPTVYISDMPMGAPLPMLETVDHGFEPSLSYR